MLNSNLTRLLILTSMWGPSFFFIKIAVEEIPPLTLVAIRLSLAAALLSLVLRLNGVRFPAGRKFWLKFAIMGFIATALPFSLFSIGEQFADSTVASILNGTTPIFTVVIAHYWIKERFTPAKVLGVVVGFAGVVLVFFDDLIEFIGGARLGGNLEFFGLLAFVAAGFCYGLSITYGRRYLRGLPPLVGPAAQLICASAMIVPLALLFDRPFDLSPSLGASLSLATLAIWGTALAYIVYYQLVEHATATFLSLVTYLIPLIGILLGATLLDEPLTWNILIGFGLILIGVLIVNVSGKAPVPQPVQAEV